MEILNQHMVPYASSSNQPAEGDYEDNLYPGYKFLPSDSDLIVHYLKPKIATGTHPPCRLHEVYLYDHHPQQLSETYRAASENKWYFLTPRVRRYPKGSRPKRSTKGFGRWKATLKRTPVYDDVNTQIVVGERASLAFYDDKDHKTEWLMHEYTTDDPKLPFGSGQNRNELNKYVLCKVYKKETSKNTDDNQTQEIQNERNQEEVERRSPSAAYSLPVNHGSILDQGTMNTTHHQNPIMQPGSSSIQPASEEDPNYQGFRGEVQTFFKRRPLPADGYVNNNKKIRITRVPLSPSPVGISSDDRRSQFQNTSHHPILQPGVTSTKSASEEDRYQGFMRRREVETCFVAAPPLPADGYINNYTTVVLSPSPPLPAEFQNQSGSNDRQSVLTQDATNDHIPQPCWPCDYNATNTQDAMDHVPQPCDYDEGGLMSLDSMEHFTLDDLDWSHKIISEIDRNDAAAFEFYLLTNSLDH